MNYENRLAWLRLAAAILLVSLMLSGCGGVQGFKVSLPQVGQQPPTQAPTVVEAQSQQVEATSEPAATQPPPAAATATSTMVATPTPAGIPGLLKDFPLFGGAQVDPQAAYADEDEAGMLIYTDRGPAELEVFYRQALDQVGWSLRYSEGNPAGGFTQEWRKDQQFMTVEYHFVGGQPGIHVDLRTINTPVALVVLNGFPLPNGTLVTNADGPSIELYVPQDYMTTRQYFLQQMFHYGWKVEDIKPIERCATRSCGETLDDAGGQVALEPAPTPDRQKAESYYVTVPTQTRIHMTFEPHRGNTRVYVDVDFNNPYRSWLPIPPYPNAEIQASRPHYMMFTTTDAFDVVLKTYEDSLYYYGWRQDPDAIKISKKTEYTNAWTKEGKVLVITLSAEKGKTYGTLSCSRCMKEKITP